MSTSNFFSNGQIGRLNKGSSPGCITQCGDGTFEDCRTGVGTACAGSGDDWCCDCTGCGPGKCDADPVNPFCQSYFDTYGSRLGGCQEPNTNPCYTVDVGSSTLVADTTNCNCPGANVNPGQICDKDTGTYRQPRGDEEVEDDQTAPSSQGDTGGVNPEVPSGNRCYTRAPELFGDNNYREIPCKCMELRGTTLLAGCVFPDNESGDVEVKCDCTYYTVDTGIEYRCRERHNGEWTNVVCDPSECNCHSDCDAGETCTSDGICV